MPHKSRWPLSVPYLSIPTFIFGPPATDLKTESSRKLFIDPDHNDSQFLTLSSLREWCERLASGLSSNGLKSGDRVIFMSPNSIFTPVVVLGILMAGGIYVSANPSFTSRELTYQINDCKAKIIIAAESLVDIAKDGASLSKSKDILIYDFSNLDLVASKQRGTIDQNSTSKSWTSLLPSEEGGSSYAWEDLNTAALANRTALLIYSSGTTGLPKGVEVTHYNVIANTMQILHMGVFNTDPSRSLLGSLPMFHGLGLVYYTFVSTKARLPVYIMPRFSLRSMLQHIERFQITDLLLVPPMVLAMAKSPSTRHFNLTSIRLVWAGAAPLGMEATTLFEKLWPKGKPRLRQAYGMSEIPCLLFAWYAKDTESPSSTSVGELLPGAEAIIVDEQGVEVKTGEVGELWCRAPNVMKGYWNNAKATREIISKQGWLKTGDIAYVDEDSKFLDRRKELIKVKGAQVAPAGIEALLIEHPHILDAAVIGLKTADDDELPRAYVVLHSSGTSRITEVDIVNFVNTRLSRIKHLTGGVRFIERIPRNPWQDSAKIAQGKRKQGVKAITGNTASLISLRMGRPHGHVKEYYIGFGHGECLPTEIQMEYIWHGTYLVK